MQTPWTIPRSFTASRWLSASFDILVDTTVSGEIWTVQFSTSHRADTLQAMHVDGGLGAAFATSSSLLNNAYSSTDQLFFDNLTYETDRKIVPDYTKKMGNFVSSFGKSINFSLKEGQCWHSCVMFFGNMDVWFVKLTQRMPKLRSCWIFWLEELDEDCIVESQTLKQKKTTR